jgi:ABC-type branched-subunit amino acid transport system permease subunit
VALVLGGFIAAIAGILFGLPSLRIKGFYLGASTLGAQFFFEWLFTNFHWFSNNTQTLTISAPGGVATSVEIGLRRSPAVRDYRIMRRGQ